MTHIFGDCLFSLSLNQLLTPPLVADGFVCLRRLAAESALYPKLYHSAHFFGDCKDKDHAPNYHAEQTFNLYSRDALKRIFNLVQQGNAPKYYLRELSWNQNLVPITQYLAQRKELRFSQETRRMVVNAPVEKKLRSNSKLNGAEKFSRERLCSKDFLYFHFLRWIVSRVKSVSSEMFLSGSRATIRNSSSTALMGRTALACAVHSPCPLASNSGNWWCCPGYGRFLKVPRAKNVQQHECKEPKSSKAPKEK